MGVVDPRTVVDRHMVAADRRTVAVAVAVAADMGGNTALDFSPA
jgi:hypothetical protein